MPLGVRGGAHSTSRLSASGSHPPSTLILVPQEVEQALQDRPGILGTASAGAQQQLQGLRDALLNMSQYLPAAKPPDDSPMLPSGTLPSPGDVPATQPTPHVTQPFNPPTGNAPRMPAAHHSSTHPRPATAPTLDGSQLVTTARLSPAVFPPPGPDPRTAGHQSPAAIPPLPGINDPSPGLDGGPVLPGLAHSAGGLDAGEPAFAAAAAQRVPRRGQVGAQPHAPLGVQRTEDPNCRPLFPESHSAAPRRRSSGISGGSFSSPSALHSPGSSLHDRHVTPSPDPTSIPPLDINFHSTHGLGPNPSPVSDHSPEGFPPADRTARARLNTNRNSNPPPDSLQHAHLDLPPRRSQTPPPSSALESSPNPHLRPTLERDHPFDCTTPRPGCNLDTANAGSAASSNNDNFTSSFQADLSPSAGPAPDGAMYSWRTPPDAIHPTFDNTAPTGAQPSSLACAVTVKQCNLLSVPVSGCFAKLQLREQVHTSDVQPGCTAHWHVPVQFHMQRDPGRDQLLVTVHEVGAEEALGIACVPVASFAPVGAMYRRGVSLWAPLWTSARQPAGTVYLHFDTHQHSDRAPPVAVALPAPPGARTPPATNVSSALPSTIPTPTSPWTQSPPTPYCPPPLTPPSGPPANALGLLEDMGRDLFVTVTEGRGLCPMGPSGPVRLCLCLGGVTQTTRCAKGAWGGDCTFAETFRFDAPRPRGGELAVTLVREGGGLHGRALGRGAVEPIALLQSQRAAGQMLRAALWLPLVDGQGQGTGAVHLRLELAGALAGAQA